MNCKNCGVSMFDKPLSRPNPKGQSDAGWMCQDCIKLKEPELYQNLIDDGDLKITNDILRPLMTKNIEMWERSYEMMHRKIDIKK